MCSEITIPVLQDLHWQLMTRLVQTETYQPVSHTRPTAETYNNLLPPVCSAEITRTHFAKCTHTETYTPVWSI